MQLSLLQSKNQSQDLNLMVNSYFVAMRGKNVFKRKPAGTSIQPRRVLHKAVSFSVPVLETCFILVYLKHSITLTRQLNCQIPVTSGEPIYYYFKRTRENEGFFVARILRLTVKLIIEQNVEVEQNSEGGTPLRFI